MEQRINNLRPRQIDARAGDVEGQTLVLAALFAMSFFPRLPSLHPQSSPSFTLGPVCFSTAVFLSLHSGLFLASYSFSPGSFGTQQLPENCQNHPGMPSFRFSPSPKCRHLASRGLPDNRHFWRHDRN